MLFVFQHDHRSRFKLIALDGCCECRSPIRFMDSSSCNRKNNKILKITKKVGSINTTQNLDDFLWRIFDKIKKMTYLCQISFNAEEM